MIPKTVFEETLLQFLAPILQLCCGVFIAHETVPGSEWVGFGVVWVALAMLTYDSLAQVRESRARRVAQGAEQPAAA